MKIELFLRIAKNKRGFTVKADTKLICTPLIRGGGYGTKENLPTAITKLNLTIPDSLFNPVRAQINAEITDSDIEIIEAEVEEVE